MRKKLLIMFVLVMILFATFFYHIYWNDKDDQAQVDPMKQKQSEYEGVLKEENNILDFQETTFDLQAENTAYKDLYSLIGFDEEKLYLSYENEENWVYGVTARYGKSNNINEIFYLLKLPTPFGVLNLEKSIL